MTAATPLRLLLVEDSRMDAELLLAELRRHGFEPETSRVDDERGLRDALAQADWQMVLCDHGLPGFSSFDALRVVQETQPDLPFVILSGTIGEERAVEALKSGVRDVVVKSNLARLGPVVERELTESANRIEQRRLERERSALEDELLRVNDELSASEQRYRLLFDRNPQPMLVYDRQTLAIVNVNEAMIADSGYARGELLSLTLPALVPPEDADGLLELLGANPEGIALDQTGRLAVRPWRQVHKDGTVVDVEVTSADLTLDGRGCRIVLLRDVTERNRAVAELASARDQAVEASNMKSAFLANISHEIRTPMNGVIGMNELLRTTVLDDEQRFFAEQIDLSSEHMMSIVNDMLDISRIETGQLRLLRDRFSVRDVVDQVCAAPAIAARAKGLRFALHVSETVPQLATGDDGRLRQILLNLVANAVKFTDDGAVDVKVGIAARGERSFTLRGEVTDTGIGIEPGALEHIFEPFTQADSSTTRRHGGAGLGLAIARELATLMDGTIGARSTPGVGTTVWFEVQLDSADGARRAETQEPPWHPAPIVADTRDAPLILVVEDSQINQIVAARALERCGFRADVVDDGLAALEALANRHYDAVLMDCQMPTLDGYQATIRLRAGERPGEHMPVIAMTAHAMPTDRDKCLAAGMDDYIIKPMRHGTLLETLRRWLPVTPSDNRTA